MASKLLAIDAMSMPPATVGLGVEMDVSGPDPVDGGGCDNDEVEDGVGEGVREAEDGDGVGDSVGVPVVSKQPFKAAASAANQIRDFKL